MKAKLEMKIKDMDKTESDLIDELYYDLSIDICSDDESDEPMWVLDYTGFCNAIEKYRDYLLSKEKEK